MLCASSEQALLNAQTDDAIIKKAMPLSIPLEKGNKWFYSYFSHGTEYNSVVAEVISDTLLFDSLKYFRVNFRFLPGSNSDLLRCDSNIVYFFNYTDTSQAPALNFEAAPGDRWNIQLGSYFSVAPGYTSTTSLFNTATNIFEYHFDGLQKAIIQVSPDFGFTRIEDYGDAASVIPSGSYVLKGCILSGISYGVTVSVNREHNLINDFTLEQNYPNPFNSGTIIKYSLPRYSNYKITLYDLSGRVTRILDSGSKEAGTYTYRLADTGLSSGVYFVEMNTDSFSRYIKILLLK
jgi:hypothetical protein